MDVEEEAGATVLDDAATAATVEDTEAEAEVEEEVGGVELLEDDLPVVVAECDACEGEGAVVAGSSWYFDS